MPFPKLNNLFQELTRYINPRGTPALQEIIDPTNGTRTLLIRFESIKARTSFTDKVGLSQFGCSCNHFITIFKALGFEPTNPWCGKGSSDARLEFKLTNHPGYNVTIHAYQNILLPSYSPEENSWINRFKERLDEKKRKYQGIRDRLRNYRSPGSSPVRSPQAESSGFFSAHNSPASQYEQYMWQAIQQSHITAYQHGDIPGPSNFLQTAQSSGPIRRQLPLTSQRPAPYQQPQRSSPPRSPVYTSVPVDIPRPHAPRPPVRVQTPYTPQSPTPSQPSSYSQRSAEYRQFFDEDDESWMDIARPPSRNR
ncbi:MULTISPECIES: hypothetical protein [Xenorhabdus]|uniref:Uncharacterized protein n=1 Tax=Xenorhabdus ehlersii TaxID=290111 RepID=A0A2D0IJX3_9GAMM|nr:MULTISPECIES: hypothetical protein [Xenorhabdus]MBC8950051.1 hypothetical protein [Xenorhabdus sp. TS4]PHM22075.1 hypothetical protein Xehl_03972 [Xenorhabdus ehlersii]RKE90674.1 hypothetical protein BDE27_2558 [Xenorhabdus ehlersii]